MKKTVRTLKKFISPKGETLVELLVSIMVIAISVLLLVGMYQASGSINRAAREMDDELYNSVTEVGNRAGESQKGTVTFEINDPFADGFSPDDSTGEIEVDIYFNDTVSAYSKAP